jgi:polyisoprenoid-binding protein YceI
MTDAPDITGHWDIDPTHSRLGFSTRHAMVSRVRGAFNEVSGSVDIAEDLSDSTATVVIETASVDTRSEDRDTHLRSADFFDVETYPQMRFVSSAIDEVDEGSYIVTGELTIRDMTKTVSVPLELIGIDTDPFGNLRAGLEGSRRIDRKDWGVTWNTKLDSGGVLVSDKITLEFELSLIKKVDEAAPETPETTAEATPAPEAPESVTPTPAAEETAPSAPRAPESAASVAPNAEPAGTEFPPPPPVKPAETHADNPAETAPEAKQSDAQPSGGTFGKLFGLR